jgi:SCO1/SenC
LQRRAIFYVREGGGSNPITRTLEGEIPWIEACPLILTGLSKWLNAIGPDADKLNVLFISIDPERDTSARLKEYLSSFGLRIRGLTGTGERFLSCRFEP